MSLKPPRAAVIGAGFGGLALAIRLQAAGHQVSLFEARDKPGGRAYVYHDDGFTFDAGPTVITDPTALAELFDIAGRRMEDYVTLLPVRPFYRLCWQDGARLDYDNDQAALEARIARFNPADVDGYRRFLAFAETAFEQGYVRLGAVPFLHFRDMLAASPQLARLRGWSSVYATVARFIADEHLRQAFSFHTLLVGGDPFHSSSIYSLIHALERKWGVLFARGGTGALVAALVRLFTELGGKLHLGAPVERIIVEAGRVTGLVSLGRHEAFDLVASNADVVHTYRDLLAGHEPSAANGRKLARKRFSNSLFVVHFGLRRTHPELAHHTVCFGPRYRGLIHDIFNGPDLPEDFSLYLHNPCVTDASLAPPGCASFYVLAPVPHLGHADPDWARTGPLYRDRILAYLEQHHIPGLRADMLTCRIFTPEDFRDQLGAHLGSAFSLEPILTQSAWFRPHNRDDRVGNLYIVGAGTHPGAGLPGVIGSAKATAGLMLHDFPPPGGRAGAHG